MKKLLLLSLATCLTACTCQTRCSRQPLAASVLPTHLPVVLAEENTPTPSAQTLSTTQVHPVKPSKDTPASNPTQVIPPQPLPQEAAGFTPVMAEKLIAQDRARQTLAEPPADKPAFKNEGFISCQDRLFSPMAYEPVFPDNTHAPWSNESLQYGIYYSFIKAGTAYIKTRGLVSKNGKTAYLIQTTALSASVIDSVYKVRDINYSWLDANSLHSLGYSQSLREGNYKRDEWLTFDDENGRFYGQVQKKEEPRAIAGELKQQVLDILTSLYYVRAKPLEVGKDVTFDIVNREQQYPLVVKVLGKETVKTPAGKFNCWVVEPQFRGEGIFVAKGKSLKVWLTDDQYRMPVKMSVEVFIGSVSAELLDYTRN